ncbi:hypothetical protein [Candidatus Lokiarchaeum ossiferum]
MTKKQVTITLDHSIVHEMEQIREDTGLPISTQIELKMKGYIVRKEHEPIAN